MIRTSWIRMKRKPPMRPKYIHTSPVQKKPKKLAQAARDG